MIDASVYVYAQSKRVPTEEGMSLGEVVEACRQHFDEENRTRGVSGSTYAIVDRDPDSNKFTLIKIRMMRCKTSWEGSVSDLLEEDYL